MAKAEHEETRAFATLPHLDIAIVHRRPKGEGEAEEMLITLRATPTFEAFARFLEATNPLAVWMRLVQAAWAPWLGALGPPSRGPREIGRDP